MMRASFKMILYRMRAYIILIRPVGWVPFYFPLLFGLIDAGFKSLGYVYLMLLIYGPLLLGGIYTLNFYSDVEVDKRSNVVKDVIMAKQPFASGQVGGPEGIMFASILILLGLSLSLLINLSVFLLALLSTFIGVIYSFGPRLKDRPFGDIIANSLAATISYLAGWSACDSLNNVSIYPLLWIFCLVAATYLLTVLIDIEADRKVGLTTTAIFLGINKSFKLSFAIYIVSILFYIKVLIHQPSVAYILMSPFLLIKGLSSYSKRLRGTSLNDIYQLAKKATISSAISVVFLLILYTSLATMGLTDQKILEFLWYIIKAIVLR